MLRGLLSRIKHSIQYRMLPDRDVVVACQGSRMLVRNPRRSVIGRSIYLNGYWEPEETERVVRETKPEMTVLDIGADVGYYTLLFARLVGKQGRVLAFEPIPKAREYLARNVSMNEYRNITILDFALFDRAGVVCLEAPFRLSRLNLAKQAESQDDVQVEMKVFDDWSAAEGIARVDLLKVDVEGAELGVLRGMRRRLESDRPVLIIEIHPEQLGAFGHSSAELVEFLASLGYTRLEPIDRPALDLSGGNITVLCRHDAATA